MGGGSYSILPLTVSNQICHQKISSPTKHDYRPAGSFSFHICFSAGQDGVLARVFDAPAECYWTPQASALYLLLYHMYLKSLKMLLIRLSDKYLKYTSTCLP